MPVMPRVMTLIFFSEPEMEAIAYAQIFAKDDSNPADETQYSYTDKLYYKNKANDALMRNIDVFRNELICTTEMDETEYDEIMFYYRQFIECLAVINH